MIRRLAITVFGALALLLSPGHAAEAVAPYDIDVILPITGTATFLGVGEQFALSQLEKQLAAKNVSIGGRPVRFVVHDDQSNPQVALQLTNSVLSRTPKPAVILGSTLVAMCNAMAPLMRNGPVMFCFSPGIYPAQGSYVFSSSVSTHDLIASLVRFYRSRGWTRIVLVNSTDASGQDAARNLRDVLGLDEMKGVELVGQASFNPTDISVSAQVQRLKSLNPQAVIAWSSGASIGTVFRAISDANLSVPVGTTDANQTHAQMREYAAILPNDLFIPSSVWPASETVRFSPDVEQAKQAYQRAYEGTSTKADASGTFAWDPAEFVVTTLAQLGPDATAAQLREAITTSRGFAGVNGIYDFSRDPQRGLDDSNVVVTRWNRNAATWSIVSTPRGMPIDQK